MEYLVFIRFEESPAVARRHIEAAESAEAGNYVLNSRYYARPGEETPWLEQALSDARGRGVFIALYRGRPVGHDFDGNALFYPLDLVWCKDDVELAEMIGVPLSESLDTGASSHREGREADEPRSSKHWESSSRRAPSGGAAVDKHAWATPQQTPEDTRLIDVPAGRWRADESDMDSSQAPVSERERKSPALRTAVWFVVCLVASFIVAYCAARLFLGD
ncbi:hypothetical protein [Alicyclobacillus shizuokensis]|uniref:hypothetical protein n=1 Tax=Alicyclobacillus shizuokensis TaxID=392014 RepID=UPI00082A5FAE|nr:hypothetical protein [Alicyclobacillus shizuokensis]MCL6627684.1 hypothetical protein [Alicyclobacillus shizuokensis]